MRCHQCRSMVMEAIVVLEKPLHERRTCQTGLTQTILPSTARLTCDPGAAKIEHDKDLMVISCSVRCLRLPLFLVLRVAALLILGKAVPLER